MANQGVHPYNRPLRDVSPLPKSFPKMSPRSFFCCFSMDLISCLILSHRQVYVDGPYGTPSRHIFEAEHAVLIGSGIGVTPFASILQSIMYRFREAEVTCPSCDHRFCIEVPKSVMNLKKVKKPPACWPLPVHFLLSLVCSRRFPSPPFVLFLSCFFVMFLRLCFYSLLHHHTNALLPLYSPLLFFMMSISLYTLYFTVTETTYYYSLILLKFLFRSRQLFFMMFLSLLFFPSLSSLSLERICIILSFSFLSIFFFKFWFPCAGGLRVD